MSAIATPADVYAEQLFRQGQGYPLWDPEPRDVTHWDDTNPTDKEKTREALIGDVGFLYDGGFVPLFNAMKPADDKINEADGVPDGYKPFHRSSDFADQKKEGALPPGPLCSRNIKQLTVSGHASAYRVGAALEFRCMEDQGALLVIKEPASRDALFPSRRMANYMKQNISSWHNLLTEKHDVDIPKDDLLFVCGVVKTVEWAMASYVQSGRSAHFKFTGDFGMAGAAFAVSGTEEAQLLPVQKWGPRASRAMRFPQVPPPPPVGRSHGKNKNRGQRGRWTGSPQNSDQRLSVDDGYARPASPNLTPPKADQVMKAAAGNDELPPEPPRDSESGQGAIDEMSVDDIEIERFPAISKPYDPVEFILDYVLKYSRAECAIAHDRDINTLCERHGCEIPDDITGFLETIKPHIEVTEDGLGMLSHEDIAVEEPAPPAEQFEWSSNDMSGVHQAPLGNDETDPHTFGVSDDVADMPIDGRDDAGAGEPLEQQKAERFHNGAITELDYHTGGVTSLAYSPDGNYIASGADDALVIIWDAHTGQRWQTCISHMDTICSLAFSPDSRELLSGAGDGVAIIWDVHTGQLKTTLRGHIGIVYSVAYSPNGSVIATGSVDASVRLWDAASGQQRSVSRGHNAIILIVAFSPNNKRVVSASADYGARVWNVADGSPISVLEGHQGVIYTLAYAPDSRRLVTGSDDGTARIWNGDTGDLLVTLGEHTGSVWATKFSPDGRKLLSAASDGTIKIWDSYSGEKLHSIEGGDALVNAATFSPNGLRICASSGDNSIRVWDARTMSHLTTLTGHSDKVSHLRFSPDGNRIVSSSDDGLLRIWDLPLLGVQELGLTEI